MKLVVGLGNPGKEYARTRHNVGWLILDLLAGEDTWQTSTKAGAAYVKTELNKIKVELLKPTTYMNNSGQAVAYAVKKHKLKTADVIVVHDDKDIPIGQSRVQRARGAAGHNGVQSIIDHLGTNNFWRIRVGVAPSDRPLGDTANFVLGRLTSAEQKILKDVFVNVTKEITELVSTDHA
ncbi:MAG: aminoacyl-tRNA hydrolase [Candidatus Magasanikbacteria bacterium]|nr:aminoacyl-tRNA hydrolase [Candidatus Magasanikbacteria bacterium]